MLNNEIPIDPVCIALWMSNDHLTSSKNYPSKGAILQISLCEATQHLHTSTFLFFLSGGVWCDQNWFFSSLSSLQTCMLIMINKSGISLVISSKQILRNKNYNDLKSLTLWKQVNWVPGIGPIPITRDLRSSWNFAWLIYMVP